MSDFEAALRHEADVAVVELRGRLDGSATSEMEAIRDAVGAGGLSGLLLDFSGVDYINSTGIALIVGVGAKAWNAHLPVLVCGLTDHYRHIFEITRITDFISLHPNQQTALAAHGRPSEPRPVG